MSSSIPTSGKKFKTSAHIESEERIDDILDSKVAESNDTVRNLLKTFEHHESYEGQLKELRREKYQNIKTTAEHADYEIRIYFPLKFEAFRKLYLDSYTDFIKSICTTDDWSDNEGGKSGSSFLKTKCEKFILKEVNKKEMKMFE